VSEVPQYFRYNQLFDLAIDFPQQPSIKREKKIDPYFNHMFSQISTEYLIESDDGDYSKMVCLTELDQSHETQLAKSAKSEGKDIWW